MGPVYHTTTWHVDICTDQTMGGFKSSFGRDLLTKASMSAVSLYMFSARRITRRSGGAGKWWTLTAQLGECKWVPVPRVLDADITCRHGMCSPSIRSFPSQSLTNTKMSRCKRCHGLCALGILMFASGGSRS